MGKLRDRIREIRDLNSEVTSLVRAKADAGKSKAQIRKEIRAEMEEKYGESADWSKLLQMIMKIIEALLSVL